MIAKKSFLKKFYLLIPAIDPGIFAIGYTNGILAIVQYFENTGK